MAPANFAENLGYNAAAGMYFPAGIPLIALVVLVIYNAQQEKQRAQTTTKPRK
ncbi:MAG TPA: hypothetical protein VHB79_22380 [Polyangiaceae bacterium]|nr:hypothetical protein [Polyangiaceae bacterium]